MTDRITENDVEVAAREWNEAANHAEHRPHDANAWLRADEANIRWRRAEAALREQSQPERYW